MYTSTILVALSTLPLPGMAKSVPQNWELDYFAARQHASQLHKPMAVILGKGQIGWKELSKSGQLSKQAMKLLEEKYVVVFIDTLSPKGKKLAKDFEMNKGLGIVISGSRGKLQAFRHEGALADAKLIEFLRRFGDPNRVVRRTESNPQVTRISNYYQPTSPTYSPSYTQPGYSNPQSFQPTYSPSFSSFGAGCPT